MQGSGMANVKTDFGIPFTDKPKSFTTSIQYLPEMYNNDLDKCDIYVLLQVREGSGDQEKRYRLATAWFRSDETMQTFETIDIPFLYGNHSDLKSYMLPSENNEMMPEHGFAPEDDTPTHIIVVYSSSFDGANFKGGVGSELRVKEFELKY
ncbi:PCMD domain-containing protein [Flammeovirga yaeyamensis]|uniref:PCMD domain-containing protein n=1 Tax=Flammeovirga yaeyamensis TaxID=367791 RepID=UPI001FD3AEA5